MSRILSTCKAGLLVPAMALALMAPLSACNAQEAETEQAVETPSGPVVDEADIIPADVEKALADRLRAYFAKSETAIVVATIPSLRGQPIEAVASDTFSRWGIGKRSTSRGLLLLVALNDRQLRIEVGCGLEKPVTNIAAKAIVEETIVPLFRDSDLVGGIEAGVTDLIALVDGAEELGPTSPYCVKSLQDAA